jgi:hypothetical protein
MCRESVLSCLRAAEANFDASAGGWFIASGAGEPDGDEMVDTEIAETGLTAVDLLARVAGE